MSSSKLPFALALAVAAAACHKGAPADFAPQPSRVDPAGGPCELEAAVTITGAHFYARAVQSLSAHGGVEVDDGYSANLDGIPLRNVVRISDTEIRAVIPGGLAPGVHALVVESPLGQTGTLARAWISSDLPPAQLAATTKAPAQVSNGQTFNVTVEVHNAGGVAALKVAPAAPQLTGTGAATASVTAPVPQDIPAGQSRVFTYELVATQSGTISVSASAAGLDEISLQPVEAAAAVSGQVLVQDRPALDAFAQAPVQQIVSVGQTVSLSIVVTNSGAATALATSFPEPSMGPSFQLVSSPQPQDIAGGLGQATFTWTYQAAQPGFESPSLTGGTGADANDGTPIPVSAAAWPQMIVQAPARLSVAAGTIPAQVSVGQIFNVTAVVTNGGEAAALAVKPAIVPPAGTAQFAPVGAAPAAVSIGGSVSATFTWRLKATASGPLALSFTAAGSDANSGLAVQSPPSADAQILVQTPPQFTNATVIVSPLKASTGQAVTVTLTATNSGEATALAAIPINPPTFITGVANQTARMAVPPTAQDVAGGQTATWTWSETVNIAGGPVSFIVNGSGKDQNSGAVASFPQTSSNDFTVLNGASLTMTTASAPPVKISSGQDVVVAIDVKNTGDVDAINVTPTVKLSGTATATTADPSTPTTIPGQSTQRFQWTYHVTGTGSLAFSVTVQGNDALSSLLVSASSNLGGSTVVLPAALTGVAQFPTVLNVNQSATLTYKVTNTGQATAKGVTVTATSAGASQTSAPQDIAPNATATFPPFPYQAGPSPGTLDVSVSASGTDANNSALTVSTTNSASATVQLPASLAMDISAPSTVNVGQSFQATVTVNNSGDSGATVSIPAPVAAGPAASATPASFSSLVVSGHGSRSVVFLYTASATGPLTLTANASGTDSTDQTALTATPKTSAAVTVQTPSQISATLAIPQTLPLGDTFTVTMTVFNSGDATANLVTPAAPSVDAGSTGLATLVSGPPAGGAIALLGSSSTILTWKFSAATEGTLQLDGQISGTDANDLTSRNASTATGVSPIAEAVTLASNPFADGTTFASLASFSGQLWMGPSRAGDGAVRMNGDGSSMQLVPWQLELPPAANNLAYTGAAHTIGSLGCAADSAGCGPDDESGRGLFFSSTVNGTEWLGVAGAHVNTGADYTRYLYLTRSSFVAAPGGYTDLAYSDLGGSAPTSGTNVTSAIAFHNQLFVGFQTSGGPALVAMSAMPSSIPGSGASASDMGASIMPGVGGATQAMISSMAVIGPSTGDTLYLANANGFTRTSNPSPSACSPGLLGLGILGSCGDWQNATPNALAYTAKPSITITKTSDLEPADRAVPALAVFNGRIFAARNTVAGPQLWGCSPSTGTQCSPGDWSLVAANTAGDAQLTQFNDPANGAITLLVATSQHLYVGFNNPTRGVVLYRAPSLPPPQASPSSLGLGKFEGRLGGPAVSTTSCTGPGGACPGFGGDGLGVGATRIFDGKAFSLAGAEYLYVAASDGVAPVRVYRATR